MPPSVPLWKIDFAEEPRGYFLDNSPYTDQLLGEIFTLTYNTEPLEGTTELEEEAGVYILALLDHHIAFTFEDGLLMILAVKPD